MDTEGRPRRVGSGAWRFGPLLLLLLLAGGPPARAVPLPTPADSGLFAPVAAQYQARLARLARAAKGPVTPGSIQLLLDTGQADRAARQLPRLTGDAREAALARARVALARLDFAAARPLFARLAARADRTAAEQRALLDWHFARDDAAAVDLLTRGSWRAESPSLPDLLAAGRLALDMLDVARAESCFTRALGIAAGGEPGRPSRGGADALPATSAARTGLALVAQKRRDWDASLGQLNEAIGADATPAALDALTETLIRMGRTDEAITSAQWAAFLDPCDERARYDLGRGYTRLNYAQLLAAWPRAFADSAGRAALARADSLLADGDHAGARRAYLAVRTRHPGWADAAVRIASLDFEEGRYAQARELCRVALRLCPDYGRAHTVLCKALESQRFAVDVHRADYEARFAAAPLPDVPGIERFVLNWRSLSPRHRKRVALSIAPWRRFIPVLVEGGATFYIKPLYMLLSDTPGNGTLRDQRISYDSRLWDDVRGAGGYHTVTGIEDVERTIFDRYNTVLHELSHQVHAVLTADQARRIQELYARAQERDAVSHEDFVSRYAGGSVWEYFAEAVNSLFSPRRDRYDPREEVLDRLAARDPGLLALVREYLALEDVGASYPVAYVNAGDDRVEHGKVDEALGFFQKALARDSTEENALRSVTRAHDLANHRAAMLAAADRALAARPASGMIVAEAAGAFWHGGRGLDAALALLERSRPAVRAEDHWLVDLALGRMRWVKGDAAGSLAACDSVLARQPDNPEALWGRAAALAQGGQANEAFATYQRAVRLRTGVADLRNDYARDLLWAERDDAARAQLEEARLLDPENPTAEALRGGLNLATGRLEEARAHLRQALRWGPWSDLAALLLARVEERAGNAAAAAAARAPVLARLKDASPPEYVYRAKLATWEAVHELPAFERGLLPANGGR